VAFLSAVADGAAVTVAEANAGDKITCYLTGDGWNPSGDQATITDDRLCSTQTFELPGRKTKSLTIRYVFNLSEPTDDEARLALPEGEAGFLLMRMQKSADATFAVGDYYELWPVTAGEPNVLPAEANSVDRIEQRVFVTGPVVKFGQIVAGA
jgi:hypothetical protein